MEKKIYLGLGLALAGLSLYLIATDKKEKKSNVAGLPSAGSPVIPNPQPAMSPSQMTQPSINPTAKFQNIPSSPPSGGGGGSDSGSGHHGGGGHHGGRWRNRFWGSGWGFGYPVYLNSDYGYNQCLIRNANGTTAIVDCNNLDSVDL